MQGSTIGNSEPVKRIGYEDIVEQYPTEYPHKTEPPTFITGRYKIDSGVIHILFDLTIVELFRSFYRRFRTDQLCVESFSFLPIW